MNVRTTVALEVQDLRVRMETRGDRIEVVRGVSFNVAGGSTLAVLGESGSGKSVTLRAVMRLLPPARTQIAGQIFLEGIDLLRVGVEKLGQVRGREIAMIFQEPALAFDPVFTIGEQITEVIRHHKRLDHPTAYAQAVELLERVQIPSARRRLESYPHEMSGGMLQRAMIAAALSCNPKVLLADEPTTALDATVQMQIVLLLRSLQREFGTAIVFVTHDIGVAAEVADTVAVMYAGQLVERATAGQLLRYPKHPYTQGLLAAADRGGKGRARLVSIGGAPPDPTTRLPGCAFAPRCPSRLPCCERIEPDWLPLSPEHYARCHLYGERSAVGI